MSKRRRKRNKEGTHKRMSGPLPKLKVALYDEMEKHEAQTRASLAKLGLNEEAIEHQLNRRGDKASVRREMEEKWDRLSELAKIADEGSKEDTERFIEHLNDTREMFLNAGGTSEEVRELFEPIYNRAGEAAQRAMQERSESPSVADMLAKDGYELHTGKNDEDEEILWVESMIKDKPKIPRHGNWHDVVDLQDEMIRFWMRPFGREYGRAWGEQMVEVAAEDNRLHPLRGWSRERMGWASNLGYIMQTMFQRADPIFVSDSVMDLIEASVPEFQPEPLLREDVFPTFNGLALLPRPFYVKDQHGKQLCFRAVGWEALGPNADIPDLYTPIDYATSSGVLLTAFTHADDSDDYPMRLPPGDHRIKANELPVMSICYVTPWHFDTAGVSREVEVHTFGAEDNPIRSTNNTPIDMTGSGLKTFCTFVQVMWRLAKQEITTVPRETLPRAPRKRAERSGLVSDVVVIKLRHAKYKKKNDGEDSPGVEYSHRWRVRSHIRNQWYPSLQMHRQIIIPSYIKGPEDAPLIVKPFRAYELTR
jgi:hypothetical protein